MAEWWRDRNVKKMHWSQLACESCACGDQCDCAQFVVAWVLRCDPWSWHAGELRRWGRLPLWDSTAALACMGVIMFASWYVWQSIWICVDLMGSIYRFGCPQTYQTSKISYTFLICFINAAHAYFEQSYTKRCSFQVYFVFPTLDLLQRLPMEPPGPPTFYFILLFIYLYYSSTQICETYMNLK